MCEQNDKPGYVIGQSSI